jgi:hypothetical protein
MTSRRAPASACRTQTLAWPWPGLVAPFEVLAAHLRPRPGKCPFPGRPFPPFLFFEPSSTRARLTFAGYEE